MYLCLIAVLCRHHAGASVKQWVAAGSAGNTRVWYVLP